METTPLSCSENQYTNFYMIRSSVTKDLKTEETFRTA